MEHLLAQTIQITQAAGDLIMGFYKDAYSVTDKSPDNPVTDADIAADSYLRQQLTALLPAAGWLSEETLDDPERLQQQRCWVVDPLDGTKEFVMGIPEFTVSVGLVEDGQPILGVIYNPVTRELYYGRKGAGIFLDSKPVRVSQRTQLAGAAIDASRSEMKRGEFAPFADTLSLKIVGSIAYKLARVAAGQADATWSRGPKNEWDICAGAFLIQEAGGFCVNLDNQPLLFNKSYSKVNGIIAGPAALQEPIIAALAPHRHTARTD